MLKVLRNFIIGLLIGAFVFVLALPYFFLNESPGSYYADIINSHMRLTQNERQLARFFHKDGKHLPILTYRSFVEEDAEGNPVKPGITLSQFEEQMKTLKEIGCTFITPEELLDCIENDKKLPKRAVLITFDDGSEEIYTKAFPILQKYDIQATVNVIGYYAQYHDNYDFSLLNWKQIREMKKSGLIDFQSETYYSYVTQINLDGSVTTPFSEPKQNENHEDYAKRITKDLLSNNLKLLSETGRMPIALAYPYGESNDTTTQAMKSVHLSLGFDSASNVCLNLNEKIDPYHLPRFEMNKNFEKMKEFLVYINSY